MIGPTSPSAVRTWTSPGSADGPEPQAPASRASAISARPKERRSSLANVMWVSGLILYARNPAFESKRGLRVELTLLAAAAAGATTTMSVIKPGTNLKASSEQVFDREGVFMEPLVT